MTTPFHLSRSHFLKSASAGFGYLALRALAAAQAPAGGPRPAASPLAPKPPHFPATAKRVIFLCMRGAPSHIDTFDYKPQLAAAAGQTSRYAGSKLFPSLYDFKQRGRSGLWISEAFPHVAEHADDLCLLRGMHTDQPNHAQALVQMHTGSFQFVRPSMGAWSLYGLGTGNQNLPGFISINPPSNLGGSQNFGSAFLPAAYQGTRLTIQDSSQRNRRIDQLRRGKPVEGGLLNIRNQHLSAQDQRAQIDLINALNREKLARDEHAPLVEGSIESYQLAFRMQDAVPGVMDPSDESPETLALYGIGEEDTDGFGRQCLMARRLAEAGVRFIEVGHGSWDHHANIRGGLAKNCAQTDKPIAGLLADLKGRDMLKDTLVMWGGEFGRTSYSPDGDGRDHNHRGYTLWMAGGGVKGGFSHGSTDDHGYEAVEGKVHLHDWHATVLHLLGLDHERLTYRYAGREMRLTELAGRVVHDIIA